jgi:muramoyltetrapeptide carboxypeptidase
VLLANTLREGDTVALVAPAGPLADEAALERAQNVVQSLGLVPRIARHALDRERYLAGTDEARAADFNEAARDPQVRGIFALRGGYGTMRILDAIDYDAFAADPKVVLGYSDLTALLNAITQRTGLVTFHGPVAALSPFTENETAWLRSAIMSPEPLGALRGPDAVTLASGSAKGRLCGGNLSLIAALIGTPHEIDASGALVVIEDTDEAPYRIDRMLTQLRMAGVFARAAGVVAGRFSNCGDAAAVLRERLSDVHIPVLAELPIGHEGEQWTLPIGLPASLENGTLLVEAAATGK